MKSSEIPGLTNRLIGLAAIILFAILIYVSDYAVWAVRLTMCSLFCAIIYARDNSLYDRWIAIGIIALGTLVSIIWPLLQLLAE